MSISKLSKGALLVLILGLGIVMLIPQDKLPYSEKMTALVISKGAKAMKENRYEDAIRILSRVLHVHKAAEAELMTMNAYIKIGDIDRELEFLKASMKNRPDEMYDTLRCSRIGDIYQKELKQIEKAKAQHEVCVERFESVTSSLALAQIFKLEGNVSLAILNQEKAVELMDATVDTLKGARFKFTHLKELQELYNQVGRESDAESLNSEIDSLVVKWKIQE